jgi:hypothetical protein
MRAFTWGEGGPRLERALALASLRPSAGHIGYTLHIGPCYAPSFAGEARALRTQVTVTLGFYHRPDDAEPVHSTLAGLASESPVGHWQRGFFTTDLRTHLIPLAGALLYGAADGPGWRVVVPIRIVPDAQSMAGRW